MGVRVVADLVPLGADPGEDAGVPGGFLADDEEGGFSSVFLQDVEVAFTPWRARMPSTAGVAWLGPSSIVRCRTLPGGLAGETADGAGSASLTGSGEGAGLASPAGPVAAGIPDEAPFAGSQEGAAGMPAGAAADRWSGASTPEDSGEAGSPSAADATRTGRRAVLSLSVHPPLTIGAASPIASNPAIARPADRADFIR